MKGKTKNWIGIAVIVIALAGIIGFSFFDSKPEIKTFSAYIAVPGETIEEDNRIQKKIAEKIGAKANVEWLTGQTAEEKIETMINLQEYPDFLLGGTAMDQLIENKVLLPLDDYLDDYPNLKNYLSEEQWNVIRSKDGHIYYLPIFGVYQGKDMAPYFSGEAFWIQKRVLEWAGYPQISTLDEYFDLIEEYQKEFPVTEGRDTIGFEILCDDWRWFCLENPPMFLAGYPNEGCAIVDKDTKKAEVYDTIPEAKTYFKKLNEMYHKGLIDKEAFTLSYDQYIERLNTGCVLGMVDQYWQIMDSISSLSVQGKEEYTYVPLPLTIDKDVTPQYFCTDHIPDTGSGMGITVDCKDVKGALQFLNDLLDPEIMKLRFWGEEEIDYFVDKDGKFYLNDEIRANRDNMDYIKKNYCNYVYFPHYQGQLEDGINAVSPSEQPEEYFEMQSEYDKMILKAYGHQTWKEFLGEEIKGEKWYPLYSCIGSWSEDTDYGRANIMREEVKRLWIPKVIMSDPEKFEDTWKEYMKEYEEKVDVDAYLAELNREIQRRVHIAD